MRIELEEAFSGVYEERHEAGRPLRRTGWLASAIGVAVAFGVGAGLSSWALSGGSPSPVRFELTFPDIKSPYQSNYSNRDVVITPDGDEIVFVGETDEGAQLYRRPFNAVEPVAIAGTVGARSPFLSPDGRWIGFIDGSRIQKVSIDGGAPVTITETSPRIPVSATWTLEDAVVYHTVRRGVFRVPASPLSQK